MVQTRFILTTATELKLQKAKYYLHRMKETQNNLYYLDFLCELESFLMHAGSITNLPAARKMRDSSYNDPWYLEKDFGQKPNFQDWYNEKMVELKTDPIMLFMREQRDTVVHFNFSEIQYLHNTEIIFVENIPISDSFKSVLTQLVRPPKPTEVFTKHTWHFNADKLAGNKEVISVCEKYIETLEKLLWEC